ncbi:MAG: hypothetical protein QM817_05445 [Archangium sp.]
MNRLLMPLMLCLAACGPALEGEEENEVAKKEEELLPLCFNATFAGSALSEDVALGFAGSRNDPASFDRTLSAPSAWSSTSVTANFNVGDNLAELSAVPFAGFAAGGFNLDLTVRDPTSGRVLCNARQEVLNRSTPAGGLDASAPRGNRALTCSFDATGLTVAPIARTTLEVWGTVGGFATAFVRAQVSSVSIGETRCMRLIFLP